MKRVYTDERFPGLEIVNEGATTFFVVQDGRPISSFESWEKPDGTISEACAGRRAADYFNRMDEAEAVLPLRRVEVEVKPATGDIERLMAREQMEHNPERKQALQRHLLDLMRQEESLAEAVVNHLIEAQ